MNKMHGQNPIQSGLKIWLHTTLEKYVVTATAPMEMLLLSRQLVEVKSAVCSQKLPDTCIAPKRHQIPLVPRSEEDQYQMHWRYKTRQRKKSPRYHTH